MYLREGVLRRQEVPYEIGSTGLQCIRYEQTEHFRVTRDFLNRYPSMLDTLLADSDTIE